jgi:hypothetical protein
MAVRADALTDLATVKTRLGITDTRLDSQLELMINAATVMMKDYAETEWTAAAGAGPTRMFDITPSGYVDFDPHVLRTAAGASFVLVSGGTTLSSTTLTLDDYQLMPADSTDGYTGVNLAPSWVSPWWRGWSNGGWTRLQVTGTWGTAAVPDDVVWLCVDQVAEWFRSKYEIHSNILSPDTDSALPSSTNSELAASVKRGLDKYKRIPIG